MQKLYSVKELTKISGINKNALYDLINSGLLKAIKFKTLKVTENSWNEFINKYDGYDLSNLNKPKLLEVSKK